MTAQPQPQPVPTGPLGTEPAITVTAITTLVSAVFTGLVLAVPGIDPKWEQIIIGIIVAAWPIVTAIMIRQSVVSPATAQTAVNNAVVTGTTVDAMTTPVSEMEREIAAAKAAPPDRWAVPPTDMRATRRDGTAV